MAVNLTIVTEIIEVLCLAFKKQRFRHFKTEVQASNDFSLLSADTHGIWILHDTDKPEKIGCRYLRDTFVKIMYSYNY